MASLLCWLLNLARAAAAAQALLFLEEMASIVVTPFILYFSLPRCAPAILAFVRDFTTHVPGVGDVCSLAAFDFERHGNSKYGSPAQAPKARPFPPAAPEPCVAFRACALAAVPCTP